MKRLFRTTTIAAASVTSATATLNSFVNPNGPATTAWFRYSTTNPIICYDDFGARVPASGGASLGSGSSDVSYSYPVSGLTPGEVYYFCVIAQNSLGTAYGSVLGFTTAPPPADSTPPAYDHSQPLDGFLGHCLELEGYRDDSYVATWQAHGVEGHTWEVLDKLSQSEALTFDELLEKTSGRGVPREVHAADVQELARRGWADDASGKIQITAAGKQARTEVEAETERHFFAPWLSLNENELEELASLANQLRDRLKSSENDTGTGD